MTSAIELVVREVFPGRPREDGLRELGPIFMRGYAQTLIGAAMVQIMKVIGPRRTLERMQRNFRSGGNFIETKFASTGEKTATLWFNDVSGIPAFYAGIIEEGARQAGTDTTVTISAISDPGCTLAISWR